MAKRWQTVGVSKQQDGLYPSSIHTVDGNDEASAAFHDNMASTTYPMFRLCLLRRLQLAISAHDEYNSSIQLW